MTLAPRQLALLVGLTLAWGLNWPVMKLGVTHFPPLSFRAASMLLGLPVLAAALWWLKVPFSVPRAHWRALAGLTLTNMVVWHLLVILSVPHLSSGRAAILGYTMPVFSALLGAALFGERLRPRQAAGVAAAALGVVLLLWHEFDRVAGAPFAAATMLVAAATWALGTQQLRRTTIPLPTLTLSFWMTAATTVVMVVAAALAEAERWHWPNAPAAWTIAYNAVLIFGFAHAAWFTLARSLPPVASTLSVMMIPVLGTASGALALGETLHWQDGAAAALMVAAIASVLWPQRGAAQRAG
ncbi:MAG: DMT family transporter [Burkholderiaceae bacterium]|jgi:drug/metabolite transporter (DMT)-like permease|nr:DMT family transporter [Burkholderiaceae bacterium]MCU0927907.1 DMT family transporter [Burkholderiaceae bacterium]